MEIILNIIISLFVTILGGAVLLAIEHGFIIPNIVATPKKKPLKKSEEQFIDEFMVEERTPPKLSQIFFIEPRLIRLLEIMFFSFGATLVTASVGYEISSYIGLVIGTILGVVFSLTAIWVILQWWELIATFFSYLAFIIIIFLVLSGLVTIIAKLMGFPLGFSGGIVCMGVVLMIIILGIAAKLSE